MNFDLRRPRDNPPRTLNGYTNEPRQPPPPGNFFRFIRQKLPIGGWRQSEKLNLSRLEASMTHRMSTEESPIFKKNLRQPLAIIQPIP